MSFRSRADPVPGPAEQRRFDAAPHRPDRPATSEALAIFVCPQSLENKQNAEI
jgi:hypothetical protein